MFSVGCRNFRQTNIATQQVPGIYINTYATREEVPAITSAGDGQNSVTVATSDKSVPALRVAAKAAGNDQDSSITLAAITRAAAVSVPRQLGELDLNRDHFIAPVWIRSLRWRLQPENMSCLDVEADHENVEYRQPFSR